MKRQIRTHLTIFLALLVTAAGGCSKSKSPDVSTATPQPNASASQASQASASLAAKEEADAGSNVCTLLTKEEIEAVQGEPFKSAKPSGKRGAGLVVSQCYFELPTTVNSVVLTVTQRGEGADARDPRQSWQEIFHREKPSQKKAEAEEKEPQEIEGVGDEAFWVGTRVGGALYVLQGNNHIRVSVGGAGDQAQKTEKSKALAQSVLKHL